MTLTKSLQALLAVGSIAIASCGGSGEPPAAAEQSTGREDQPVPPVAEPAPEPAPPAPVAAAPTAPAQPAPPAITPVDPATAPQPVAVKVPKNIQALIDAKDRTDADRALDAGRHPGEMLAFAGIKPGMKVADIISGGGYTTELLARAVGPNGHVYAQNADYFVKNILKGRFDARM